MRSTLENTALTALAATDSSRVVQQGSRIDLPLGETLHRAGDKLDWVYFPEGGLLSLVRHTREGQLTESGLVGFEGAAGLGEACGAGTASADCLVQVDGPAWRVRAEDVRALVRSSAAAAAIVFSTLELQMIESRQSTLCRSFHPAEARLARWLLESRDRCSCRDSLPITHESTAPADPRRPRSAGSPRSRSPWRRRPASRQPPAAFPSP